MTTRKRSVEEFVSGKRSVKEFVSGVFLNNCAVNERDGDGKHVGRCWFFVGNKDICPRHGDVHELMEHYRKTGECGEDPRKR